MIIGAELWRLQEDHCWTDVTPSRSSRNSTGKVFGKKEEVAPLGLWLHFGSSLELEGFLTLAT